MIFNIYLHISIICLILYMIYFTMSKCHIGNEINVWKEMQDLQESIEQLDEKTQNFMNNLFNNCVSNPGYAFILTMIFSFTPLIHIIVLFSICKTIIEKLK